MSWSEPRQLASPGDVVTLETLNGVDWFILIDDGDDIIRVKTILSTLL